MVGVVALVVVISMAGITSVRGIVVIALVAGKAVVFNRQVSAGHWEVLVVVESSGYPCSQRMAAFAIKWELSVNVIGDSGGVVIIDMAPVAGIRGIIVIAVMAVVAITGNSGMRAREGIVLIVVERRRHPRIFGMALLAVRREAGCSVAGAAGGIIVIAMAPKTGIGGVVEITVMAVHAVVSDGGMRASQRIILVVYIKGSRGPVRSSGMAGSTVHREPKRSMIRICCGGVILKVAGVTVCRGTCISVSVAFHASGT